MKAGKRFEVLTEQVVAAISRNSKYQTIELSSGDKNKKKGESGCEHQIDVYWEYVKDQKVEKVIIECKDYKEPVSIGRVRDFFGVKRDIGDVEAWIISSHGFQQGARVFAEYYGIYIKTLQWFKHLEIESNVPAAFLKIISFSIKRKRYELNATTNVSKIYKFSSSDGRHVELEFMEFVSLIKSDNSFKLNCKKELFVLSQKWRLIDCSGFVEFNQIQIAYEYIEFTPSVAKIKESGAKLTHLDNTSSSEYYISTETEDL